MGVEEGYGVLDFDDGRVFLLGDAAEEDSVDGGGLVLEGVEDQLNVSGLCDLVP